MEALPVFSWGSCCTFSCTHPPPPSTLDGGLLRVAFPPLRLGGLLSAVMWAAVSLAFLLAVTCPGAQAVHGPQPSAVQHLAAGPEPPVWPEQFHSVLFQNRSDSLSLVDLYYDWPGGRNLNLIRSQLGAKGTVWDLEFNNGTSFIFMRDQPFCKVLHFDVGILVPNWLANSTLAGQDVADGFVCNVWTKADFIRYYAERDAPNQPVRWTFLTSQAELHVLSFEPGKQLPQKLWQAPHYCFTGNTTPDLPVQQPLASGRLFRMPQVAAAAEQTQQEGQQQQQQQELLPAS